ncbi:MAG TPA: hypothetical protein VIV11_15335 [Kofleriaceae bacterium]
MRILAAALTISAAVHGGAVAWVQALPAPKAKARQEIKTVPIEIVPAVAIEPTPTEVTLLDDDSVAAAAPIASSRSNTQRGKAQPQISAAHSTTVETPTSKVETQPPRTKLMTMRHPKLERGPSADFWARFEANTKPLQPKDTVGEQLADEIANAEDNLKNPRWVANASPEQLAGERMRLAGARAAREGAELQPDGAGTKSDHHTFKAKFNPDGTVASLDDKRNFRFHSLPFSGEFDVTDAMMRSKGIDPYSAYKLKVLDDTRDERAAIGKRYRTQQLAQSKQHVQKNLDRLWATAHDLATRKRGLFELWDDCAEAGSEETIRAGASAREHVIGFIRTKLPAGSAKAFTAEELARLNNGRKSKLVFAPYD